jgi:isoquinoline 1-oxidoreductase subunit alpha
VELRVNGEVRSVDADPSRSLLGVLRDELDLTGTKYGCGEGQCGACTVLIDGNPQRSCVTAVGSVQGVEIRTIEGLAPKDGLHPLQESFLAEGAMQCGYCTAGMLMSAAGLLREYPDPSERQIVTHMNGNICRCGTYSRIVRAIQRAASAARKEAR